MAHPGNPSSFDSNFSRLCSFTQFPDNVPRRPQELARNGFYYECQAERVRCYWCGLVLTVDELRAGSDQAWITHNSTHPSQGDKEPMAVSPGGPTTMQEALRRAQNALRNVQQAGRRLEEVWPDPRWQPWQPDPGHLLPSAGRQGPVFVAGAVDSAPGSSGSDHDCEDDRRKKRISAGSLALEGSENHVVERSPCNPTMALKVTRLRSFEQWTSITEGEELASAGLYYTGTGGVVKCFMCGMQLHREVSDDEDPLTKHRQLSPGCAFAKNQHNLEPTESSSESSSDLEEACGGIDPDNDFQESQQQKERDKLRQQIAELEERHKCYNCKVCDEKHFGIGFIPCGHLVCCEDCARLFAVCPVCGQSISGTVRAYWC